MAAGADVVSAWTEANVLATGLGSLGIVLTLFYSAWSFRTTLRESYYAELDRVYFELLRIGLERPYLRAALPPADPARASEYEAYAFMVWNFLETVVDRCDSTSNPSLRETWFPIVATEGALHRAWFDLPENKDKFKKRFRQFIEKNYEV
ncbi:MAG: hypothetical protein ACRENE_15765 [Polyangiaceae bacterium]